MTTIAPRFDFSMEPAEGIGTDHDIVRDDHNALKPSIFNEYERLINLICDAIGDINYTDFGETDNIGGALSHIKLFVKDTLTINNSYKILISYCSEYPISFDVGKVRQLEEGEYEKDHLRRFYDGWWGDID